MNQRKNSITFDMEGGLGHGDRLKIATDNSISDWHHYSMHDQHWAAKRETRKDGFDWYKINLETGKLEEIAGRL